MTETEPGQIDMTRVYDLLQRMGIPAVLTMSGGGVATIYAGEQYLDAMGDPRSPAIAGPGSFEAPPEHSVGWLEDFYVGPDDDGEAIIAAVADIGVTTDEEVARLIAAQVAHGPNPVPLSAQELADLGFGPPGLESVGRCATCSRPVYWSKPDDPSDFPMIVGRDGQTYCSATPMGAHILEVLQ